MRDRLVSSQHETTPIINESQREIPDTRNQIELISRKLIDNIPEPEESGSISPDVVKNYKIRLAEIAARQIIKSGDSDPTKQQRILELIIKHYGPQRLKIEQLEAASKKDELTGLQNRKGAEESYNAIRKLEEAGVFKGQTVFVRLDIDNFKLVNDLLTHKEGDEVLRWVAENLETLVSEANNEMNGLDLRTTDVRIRFSGDEFGIILTDVRPGKNKAGEALTIEDTIKNILQKVIEKIESINDHLPTTVKDKIFISASAGYAMLPKNQNIPFDEADRRADKAEGTAKLLKFLERNGEDYRSGKTRIINFDWAEQGLQTQEQFRTLKPEELEALQIIQPFLRIFEQAKQAMPEDMIPQLTVDFNKMIKTIIDGIKTKKNKNN